MSAGESIAKVAITQVANGEEANRGIWKHRVSMRYLISKRVRKVAFVLKEKGVGGVGREFWLGWFRGPCVRWVRTRGGRGLPRAREGGHDGLVGAYG